MTVLWCNGSTNDFGSFSLGSNPDKTANYVNCKSKCTIQSSLRVSINLGGAFSLTNYKKWCVQSYKWCIYCYKRCVQSYKPVNQGIKIRGGTSFQFFGHTKRTTSCGRDSFLISADQIGSHYNQIGMNFFDIQFLNYLLAINDSEHFQCSFVVKTFSIV